MSEAYTMPNNVASPVGVTSSASAVTIAAASNARRRVIIYNDASTDLLIKYGAGASSASFTERIKTKTVWYMELPPFTGLISGIWEGSPTGSAMVTDMA